MFTYIDTTALRPGPHRPTLFANDCVVRTIAFAFRIPYGTAKAVAFRYMSYNSAGADTVEYYRWLHSRPEAEYVFGPPGFWRRGHKRLKAYWRIANALGKTVTVERFIAKHPKGTYVISVSGHTFAIHDGMLADNCLSNPDYEELWRAHVRIMAAWRVRPSGVFLTV